MIGPIEILAGSFYDHPLVLDRIQIMTWYETANAGPVTAAFFADHFAFTERLAKVRINPGNQVHPGCLIASMRSRGIERFKTELIKSASRAASPLPWSVAQFTSMLARAGRKRVDLCRGPAS